MRESIVRILRNKAGEGDGGGEIPKPPGHEDKPADEKPNPPGNPPAQGEGDKEYDELGYEKAPKKADEKKSDDKKAAAEKSEKVENTTGYGDKEPVVEGPPPPSEKKDDAPPPPPPVDLDKRVEGLPPELQKDVKDYTEQVQKLKLSPEQEKVLIDSAVEKAKQSFSTAKVSWESHQQALKRAQQEKELANYKDLKSDPDWSGDKFDVNIIRTSKVLREFGPEIEKRFTEGKVQIHPDLMRMLARVADSLYPDRSMVQGEPPAGKDDEDEKDKPLNPLDFYNQP